MTRSKPVRMVKPITEVRYALQEHGIPEFYGQPLWIYITREAAADRADNWLKRYGIKLRVVRVEIREVRKK